MNKFYCFLIVISLISCSKADRLEDEISKINTQIKIVRFDKAFANADKSDLGALKKEFPYLFPAEYPDSVWVARMSDSLHQDVYNEIRLKYNDFETDTSQIKSVFQHVKYYFKAFKAPKIITVISDVDYKNRVIYADSLMLIGLDNYLGSDHRYYGGIQQYIKKNFTATQIPIDVAKTIGRSKIAAPKDRTFLGELIQYGKLYYLIDLFIPSAEKNNIIGYTIDEYDWALANENYVWRYFIEKELLFSTNAKLGERFINPAPFSKFYLEIDGDSPGRIGQFIGWQIVASYMQNNEVSLQQMLNTSAEEIFNKSRYKPEK